MCKNKLGRAGMLHTEDPFEAPPTNMCKNKLGRAGMLHTEDPLEAPPTNMCKNKLGRAGVEVKTSLGGQECFTLKTHLKLHASY